MESEKPVVLFLFNSSTYAVQPWLDDGRFECVSVDYDDTDHHCATLRASTTDHMQHTRLSIDLSMPDARLWVLRGLRDCGLPEPSLVISFAPCTDLAVSGAKHFQRKLEADPDCQNRAVRMARLASAFGCPYMVENPVSVLATMWKKPAMYWHPWEFSTLCPPGEHPEFPGLIPNGDAYCKKSGIWAGQGFVLPVKTNTLPPEETDNPGWAKLGGKSARTKHIRSLTPRGFARAIYYANANSVLKRFTTAKTRGTLVPEFEQLELFT